MKLAMLNKKGMSIVSALVAVGMAAIAVMGTLAIFNNQLMGQKYVEQRYGVIFLNNEIYQMLSESKACEYSYVPLDAFAYSSTMSPTIHNSEVSNVMKQIRNKEGRLSFRTYNDPDPAATPAKTFESGSLKISQIQLGNYVPDVTPPVVENAANIPEHMKFYSGKAVLKIVYEKTSISAGAKTFPREFKLQVDLKNCSGCPGVGVNCDPSCGNLASEDKKIKTCRAFGGGSGGDTFWNLTGTADGIFYDAGKVGIGTNNPDRPLKVKGTFGVAPHSSIMSITRGRVGGPVADLASGVRFEVIDGSGNDVFTGNVFGGLKDATVANKEGFLSFYTKKDTDPDTGATSTEKVRIDGDGNVGIGTSNPAAKLDVQGDVKIGNSTTAACSSANQGSMRFDSIANSMLFCDGATWRTISTSAVKVYSDTDRFLGGNAMCAGVYTAPGLCNQAFTLTVTFPGGGFTNIPKVIAAPIDISEPGGCVGQSTDRLLLQITSITETGFTVRGGGSPVTGACGGGLDNDYTAIRFSWLAIGN